MKKLVISAAIAIALLGSVSCKSVHQTATTQEIATAINSSTSTDLEVNPVKISYFYKPTKAVRRAGNNAVMETAVSEALKANGNADVLVHPQYKITKKRGSILEVVVSGYPATYKNFTVNK